MRLGLFNWTSDLSDESEYPPFFDNLRICEDDKIGAEGTAIYDKITNARGNCSVLIDGGGGFNSTDIGSIEYLQDGGEGFGWESGVYLVLDDSFMSSWEMPYFKQTNSVTESIATTYWNYYKPAVKEKFEKDPDAWCLATTGFTPKQIRDNFVFWDEEDCYVCVNPYWNTKAVELLTAQTPSRMRRFNKCIVDNNPFERMDEALRSLSASLSSLNK